MTEILAIDFGTSWTKVAYCDTRSGQPVLMHHNNDLPFVPSLFYLPRGNEQVFWGQEAEDALEDDPAGVVDVLKRRLKEPLVRANGRRLKPGELLTQLLKGLRQRAGMEVAAFAGRLPDKVVLTHPVLFGPVEDDLLRDAAKTAGFQEVELIPEPVAAARAWLLETGEASAEVIVLDCGGGTLDWAYLRRTGEQFTVVADCPPGGDQHLGGHDVDEELLRCLEDRLNEEAAATVADKRNYYLRQVRLLKELYCKGLPLRPIKVGGQAVVFEESEIKAVFEERFIRQVCLNLQGYLARVRTLAGGLPTVLLVGGSSRLTGLAEALEKQCGVKTARWEHSDFATVRGALGPVPPPIPDPLPVPTSDVSAETVQWYRTAAEQGKAEAQGYLGVLYANGWGMPQNDGEAVQWYRKAAEQGDADAQCNLGWMYQKGRGVSRNYREAVQWYRQAAEQGHADAQNNLGLMYGNGRGVPKDQREAKKWYKKAAKQGHALAQKNLQLMRQDNQAVPNPTQKSEQLPFPTPDITAETVRRYRTAAEQGKAEAQFYLGGLYSDGWGLPQDDREAVRWWRKAAEQGQADAQCNLGCMYANGHGLAQNDREAVQWWRKAAEQGNANAQFNLGMAYLEGRGVAQNDQEAIRWLRKAAEQANASAQFNLGMAHLKGRGVAQNDQEAIRWWRKAAEQGHAGSQYNLGFAHLKGHGVAQDDREAVRWWRKAAEQEFTDAQAQLGWMYENGRGVARNYQESVRWYRKAAEQGDADAQCCLGVMYANGNGVARNDQEAISWWRKAAEQGNTQAQSNLNQIQSNGFLSMIKKFW